MLRPSLKSVLALLFLISQTIGCAGDDVQLDGSSTGGESTASGWGNGGGSPGFPELGDGNNPGSETPGGDEAAGSGFGSPESGEGGEASAPSGEHCFSDADCVSPTPHCAASGYCLACLDSAHCEAGELCSNGVCLPGDCTPGETLCSGTSVVTCDSSGANWSWMACPGDPGSCVAGACEGCEPGYAECLGKNERLVCLADGSGMVTESCGENGFCVEGECLECYPGTNECDGDWLLTCSAQGMWEQTEDCSASFGECAGGSCISPCGQTGKLSNEGCDYWVVDMDNKGPAASSPYAVIVSNLSQTSVSVSITAKTSATAEPIVVASGEISPDTLEVFQLPQQNMGTTGVFWKALRLQSTGPIVAYQFNPLENVEVYSNDASLLLPSNTYGTEYLVVSREEIPSNEYGAFRGSISVVAPAGQTEVTIQPTAPIKGGSGFPAMNAGEAHTVTLAPYQVLNLQSDMLGSDLTGTVITSNKPIAVFGGHEAAVGNEQCCADHLEQQLFPVATWGKTYVATKSQARGIEMDYWRILAAEDGTSVTLSPSIPGVSNPMTLNRGEFYEFQTDMDFVINATKPVMVAQTLPSSAEITGPVACTSTADCAEGYSCSWVSPECMLDSPYCNADSECPAAHSCRCSNLGFCTCEPIGDPALILSAPVEQYRSAFVFLTPTNFVQDYVNIVAEAGTSVTLDGTLIPPAAFESIGDGTYQVARLQVVDGVHHIESSAPVGVVAYGYDEDVSYGYPAGLSLSEQP